MNSTRAAQAIDSVRTDLKVPGRGIDVLEKGSTTNHFINKLWNAEENRDVVNKFLNNDLCSVCAENKDPKACLEWFQTYAIQDLFYLIDYLKFKALCLTAIPQGEVPTMAVEVESISKVPGYVTGWLHSCMQKIRISPERIAQEERSVAELAYANYLQVEASREDWFNGHVIMIARVYGWSILAKELYDRPSTDRSSVFYTEFILANIDTSDRVNNPDCLSKDARELSAFLDQNVNAWGNEIDQKKKWSSLFRTSFRLEVALFHSAFSPYGA